MKKIFMDVKITGLDKDADMISIAMVDLDGNHFYAESLDWDSDKVTCWVEDNVINKLLIEPNLEFGTGGSNKTKNGMLDFNKNIAKEITRWLEGFQDDIEIWGDCISYNWVMFCDLFGGAINIPGCINGPLDISTLFKTRGIYLDTSRIDFISDKPKGYSHNALFDAKVIKGCYEKLMAPPIYRLKAKETFIGLNEEKLTEEIRKWKSSSTLIRYQESNMEPIRFGLDEEKIMDGMRKNLTNYLNGNEIAKEEFGIKKYPYSLKSINDLKGFVSESGHFEKNVLVLNEETYEKINKEYGSLYESTQIYDSIAGMPMKVEKEGEYGVVIKMKVAGYEIIKRSGTPFWKYLKELGI